MKTEGFVILNDVEAKDLAIEVIKAISDYRVKLYSDYVDRELTIRNSKIAKKWFGKKVPLTRDQVIELLREERAAYYDGNELWGDHELDVINNYGHSTHSLAANLILAAESGRKQIYVVIDSYTELLSWIAR